MYLNVYNAISIDGFIADATGDTSWTAESDWKLFKQTVAEFQNIIMGRKTFDEIVQNKELDLNKTNTYVLSRKTGTNFFNSPEGIISKLQENNQSQALLIGGGSTNAEFLNADLIDEIWVSIHPLLLGNGTRMFGNSNVIKLDKYFEKDIGDGVVHVRYGV